MNGFVPNIACVRRAFAGAAIVAAALTAPAGADAPRGAARAATSEEAPLASDAFKTALARRPLQTIDGKKVTWQSLRGEVVVVNFWATWCKPCRKELPRLDKLDRELAKSGGRVLAVSVDLDAENVRRFARANKLELPICHDGPDGLARDLSLAVLPYTAVLDRTGAVAYVSTSADEAHLNALVARVKALAAEPRTAMSNEEAP